MISWTMCGPGPGPHRGDDGPADALGDVTGDTDQYFELCEEVSQAEVELEPYELPPTGTSVCLPGTPDELQPATALLSSPELPGASQYATRGPRPPKPKANDVNRKAKPSYNLKDLDLPRTPGEAGRLQSDLIPIECELSALCRDLRQFGYGDVVWRDHYGTMDRPCW